MFWVRAERSGSMRSPVALRARPSKRWLPLLQTRPEALRRRDQASQALGLELEAEVRDLFDGAARP
jgi:hypothetical protein